jgi:hypothetical protein
VSSFSTTVCFEFLKKGSIVLEEHIQTIVVSSTHFFSFVYLTARYIDFVDLCILILKEKAKFVEVRKSISLILL